MLFSVSSMILEDGTVAAFNWVSVMQTYEFELVMYLKELVNVHNRLLGTKRLMHPLF